MGKKGKKGYRKGESECQIAFDRIWWRNEEIKILLTVTPLRARHAGTYYRQACNTKAKQPDTNDFTSAHFAALIGGGGDGILGARMVGHVNSRVTVLRHRGIVVWSSNCDTDEFCDELCDELSFSFMSFSFS